MDSSNNVQSKRFCVKRKAGRNPKKRWRNNPDVFRSTLCITCFFRSFKQCIQKKYSSSCNNGVLRSTKGSITFQSEEYYFLSRQTFDPARQQYPSILTILSWIRIATNFTPYKSISLSRSSLFWKILKGTETSSPARKMSRSARNE